MWVRARGCTRDKWALRTPPGAYTSLDSIHAVPSHKTESMQKKLHISDDTEKAGLWYALLGGKAGISVWCVDVLYPDLGEAAFPSWTPALHAHF